MRCLFAVWPGAAVLPERRMATFWPIECTCAFGAQYRCTVHMTCRCELDDGGAHGGVHVLPQPAQVLTLIVAVKIPKRFHMCGCETRRKGASRTVLNA